MSKASGHNSHRASVHGLYVSPWVVELMDTHDVSYQLFTNDTQPLVTTNSTDATPPSTRLTTARPLLDHCPLLDNCSTTVWPLLDHCLPTARPLLDHCLTTVHCLTTARPLLDHCLTTVWPLLDHCPLLDNCSTTAWPLFDHCLTTAWPLSTAWQLLDHCLTTAWPLLDHCPLLDNCSTTVWPLFDNCLTTVWPLLDHCLTTARLQSDDGFYSWTLSSRRSCSWSLPLSFSLSPPSLLSMSLEALYICLVATKIRRIYSHVVKPLVKFLKASSWLDTVGLQQKSLHGDRRKSAVFELVIRRHRGTYTNSKYGWLKVLSLVLIYPHVYNRTACSAPPRCGSGIYYESAICGWTTTDARSWTNATHKSRPCSVTDTLRTLLAWDDVVHFNTDSP